MYPNSKTFQTTTVAGTAVRALGLGIVLIGTGSCYDIERADLWVNHLKSRVNYVASASGIEGSVCDVRSASQHLANVRRVLNPAIADLANCFDVSRQSVYKWLAGDSIPEDSKLSRITALSHAADKFAAAGVKRAGAIIKIKTFAGRSLVDLIKSGEYRPDHIAMLIREARTMKEAHARSGLAESKAKSRGDWKAYLSISGSPEQV